MSIYQHPAHAHSGSAQAGTNGPYIEFMAGQLIAAEVMNDMQSQIRSDITAQAQAAVDNISLVPRAQDADALEGQTLAEITQAIIDQAISQMALESGYRRLYKKLKKGEVVVVEHGLQNCPLVDLYQLEYFQVVASEDGYSYATWVNFFIYHSSEKRIRYAPEGETAQNIVIEPSKGQPYRIPFKDLLAWYKVQYNDDSSVGDLETEFWDALFANPNDQFDDNQYAHSPWFDRCCREERTVKSLKQKGDWDELWVKVVPRKTVNYEQPGTGQNEPDPDFPIPAPMNVGVSHFDLNRVGLTLLNNPVYSAEVEAGLRAEDREGWEEELKVMVLLRA
jgi:hypothetical protein